MVLPYCLSNATVNLKPAPQDHLDCFFITIDNRLRRKSFVGSTLVRWKEREEGRKRMSAQKSTLGKRPQKRMFDSQLGNVQRAEIDLWAKVSISLV